MTFAGTLTWKLHAIPPPPATRQLHAGHTLATHRQALLPPGPAVSLSLLDAYFSLSDVTKKGEVKNYILDLYLFRQKYALGLNFL